MPNSIKDHETILDSINEGVFTIDLDWKITSFNSAAERITGVKKADAIGKLCCDVFRASICENSCALQRTLSAGKPITNASAHIVNQSGDKIPVRISTALLKNGNNQVIGGVETVQNLSQLEQLKKELNSSYTLGDLVGKSASMQELFSLLPLISESNSTVLIEGASGTGKELVARAIHNLSKRNKHKFIAINCAALPDSLLESELFGFVAGAFTDAKHNKPGRFEAAHNGTIFLDEIGDISPALQVRLLRVLGEKVIEPLGSVESKAVNVRVIAATNKTLSSLVKKGRFREDLYYRINVVHLQLPPLKKRLEDLPLLIDAIIAKLNNLEERQIEGLSNDALNILLKHSFPGNIRELENILEHAFVLCRDRIIDVKHLPIDLVRKVEGNYNSSANQTLEEMETQMIAEALKRRNGNRKQTSQDLGINPSTLYRKMKRLGLL